MEKRVRCDESVRFGGRTYGWCAYLRLVLLLVGCLVAAPAAEIDRWCFQDGEFLIAECPSGPQTISVEYFPARGAAVVEQRSVTVDAKGVLHVQPLGAGIHAVTLGDRVERFVALAPPPPLNKEILRASLPHCAEQLLTGEPVTVVAFGDSVTATGDYHRFFAAMLARATGNAHITVRVAAHPGCSIDATLRNLDVETAEGVDLALLMYGLNDQGAGVPLAAYLEQYAAMVTAMQDRQADIVLMQPTPHIELPKELPEDVADPNWAFVMRVRGYAAALEDVGAAMSVPVAASFDAVWGSGTESLAAVYVALRPCFPPHYSKRWEVMPADGSGDTIHPNANGHAAMAMALYCRVAVGITEQPALHGGGVTRWTATGLVTDVTLTNQSAVQRRGDVTIFAPSEAEIAGERNAAYDLAPGASITLHLQWPAVTAVADLRRHPYDRYLVPAQCWLYAVDQQEVSNQVIPVRAVREPAVEIAVERQVVAAHGEAVIRWMKQNAEYRREHIPAPAEAAARTELHLDVDGSPVVGEAAWTRYASAQVGESTIDAHLEEWQQAVWSPLGLPVQARWTTGPADHRVTPEECQVAWSVRSGAQGLTIAVRATGEVTKDRFLWWFDPRAPEQLGTPGGYFWIGGVCTDGGKVDLHPGETSRGSRDGLTGVWRDTDQGRVMELFIPYTLLGLASWPVSGDLGCSLQWTHQGPGGTTMLQWSEDRHPWNPRWFGVIRRQAQPNADELPWMVRTR